MQKCVDDFLCLTLPKLFVRCAKNWLLLQNNLINLSEALNCVNNKMNFIRGIPWGANR
jgi:hypothetical protein